MRLKGRFEGNQTVNKHFLWVEPRCDRQLRIGVGDYMSLLHKWCVVLDLTPDAHHSRTSNLGLRLK